MYLIDTNILSELVRPKPDTGVVRFMENLDLAYLSVMTVHELTFGIERLPTDNPRRQYLQRSVEELIAQFSENIIAVGQAEARASAFMRANAEKAGRTLHIMDALLAATANVNHLTLLTRNEKDFTGLNIQVFNPWTN